MSFLPSYNVLILTNMLSQEKKQGKLTTNGASQYAFISNHTYMSESSSAKVISSAAKVVASSPNPTLKSQASFLESDKIPDLEYVYLSLQFASHRLTQSLDLLNSPDSSPSGT